jgi:hypothetical protein
MSTEKLYPIAPDGGGVTQWSRYFPGVTPAGDQVIILGEGQRMHAYWFDAAGLYLRREDRAMTVRTREPSPQEQLQGRPARPRAWARELGLTPATIRVQKFQSSYDGPVLQILDYPRRFEDGETGTDEEREELLRWWHDLGAFVLSWDGTEYTLNGEGERFQ